MPKLPNPQMPTSTFDAEAGTRARSGLEPGISLCIIAKDEERFIEGCIKSVKGLCDQIVVVDTGSTDRTVKIAESCGAEVHYFPWNDSFSEARNESLKYATREWILVLDADGELEPKSKKVVRDLVRQYSYPTVVKGRSVNFCGSGSEIMDAGFTVLFPNDSRLQYEGDIHEQIVDDGRPVQGIEAPVFMLHYGYLDDVKESKNKNERNLRILLRGLVERPDDYFNRWNVAEYFANSPQRPDSEREYLACLDALEKGLWQPGDIEAWTAAICGALAGLYFRQGRLDNVERYARKSLEYHDSCTEGLFWLGNALISDRRWSEAIPVFEKLLEENDGKQKPELRVYRALRSWRAHDGLADCWYNLGNYENAVRESRSSAKANPKGPVAWLAGSAAACGLGQFQLALKWFEMALDLGADPEGSRFVYQRLRQIATDIEPMKRTLEKARAAGLAESILAQMQLEVGNAERALKEVEELPADDDDEAVRKLDWILTVWPKLQHARTLRGAIAAPVALQAGPTH